MNNNKIFILRTKKSKTEPETTYCIAVFKLGTPYMEFILGETDNDREYRQGDQVFYVYDAEYTYDLNYAVEWLSKIK
ncbi:MAG: hypothetical protein FWF54_03340 [Candidatus Azobacteroides sp.]|nr:hypothetical protein [Candidatus Azobacteroides sp.]